MKYTLAVATARLIAVRDLAHDGAVAVYDRAILLVRVPLLGGRVEGRMLTFALGSGRALASGRPTSGLLLDRFGGVLATDLSVGRRDANVILESDLIHVGQVVRTRLAQIQHP
jgi:hypothetical protein